MQEKSIKYVDIGILCYRVAFGIIMLLISELIQLQVAAVLLALVGSQGIS